MNIVEDLCGLFFYEGHTNADSFIAMHTLTLLPDKVVEKQLCKVTYIYAAFFVYKHTPIS